MKEKEKKRIRIRKKKGSQSKRCSPRCASLPSSRLLVACAGICAASPLGELPQGSQSAGFNCLFIFPPCYIALCASKAWHRFGSEVSWCLETPLFLRLTSRDGTPFLPLLSLFLSFIFFPISFRMDWLDILAVQGTLKSLLQHHREEPRWRRSRTGRTLSPPQIHQKSI